MSWLARLLGKGHPAPAAEAAPEAGAPPMPTVTHHGFEIPQDLAIATGGLRNFTRVSDTHIELLDRYAGLANARDIVEIGCGVGRDAIPLIARLPEGGSYLGVDVMKPSIDWARQHITAADSRFTFVHFDVADAQHNPTGQQKMTNYTIPRDAESVDLVFMFSVFTHMFPADVAQYLVDFGRILRPGGRVLTSMFMVDHARQKVLAENGGGVLKRLTFRHEVEPGFFHNDPEVVPGATGYSLDRITKEVEAAGLSVQHMVKGSWALDGPSEKNGQDLLVFRKLP